MDMPKNIIELGGITTLPIDPDKILRKAIGEMSSVVVIGYDKEGEYYYASSQADGADILWLLEATKLALFNSAQELEGE